MQSFRRRVPALLGAALVAAFLTASPSAGAGTVTVSHTVTGQWNSGYEAGMKTRNDTGAPLRAWRLEFDLPHRVSSMWDAVLVSPDFDRIWAPRRGSNAVTCMFAR